MSYKNGDPFFWLGDTAWELFHRLKLEEIETYLENRKQKGFNVVQVVVLPEMDGLRVPNRYGDVPLIDMDPTKPNEKYFQFVDTVVKLAAKKGIFMGLLPTWGDKVTQLWGEGPVVFNPENAYKYGKWIGERYKSYKNIIWILGGDRPPMKDSADWRPVWRNMAKGIEKATNHSALISYHIWGGEMSTSQYIHSEKWLDINMMQSGHGSGKDVPVWEWIKRDYCMKPTKPTLDSEPNYEDHPVNPWPSWNPENGYFRDYDVRKQTYRSVFAGACGVTYGNHSIWQFRNERDPNINFAERYWTEALDRPGAFQVGYLKKLIESRPSSSRIPDQSIILEGQGEKEEYICAFRNRSNDYAMIYIPVGKTITIKTSFIKTKKLKISWFNPQTCETIQSIETINTGKMCVTTPTTGFGKDWVLIVEKDLVNTAK
ncbi:MAG TPA: glycoside hydrolase family 140 protein [Paludibacteraceae bacterium]|nr:glycoside hydrolase family 140 protein [Paludibacteraceae bacterium]HPD59590.1 glycoside hydrolase family 140 protein [Paludibacteraceae bacterium]HPQ11880.1 glycoside hydrolase family 140 protein [Paludibacteraceae bacterium]HRS23277.1 glycoside hydrolase family 140 protein [Paludibacteraceae bacterium]